MTIRTKRLKIFDRIIFVVPINVIDIKLAHMFCYKTAFLTEVLLRFQVRETSKPSIRRRYFGSSIRSLMAGVTNRLKPSISMTCLPPYSAGNANAAHRSRLWLFEGVLRHAGFLRLEGMLRKVLEICPKRDAPKRAQVQGGSLETLGRANRTGCHARKLVNLGGFGASAHRS